MAGSMVFENKEMEKAAAEFIKSLETKQSYNSPQSQPIDSCVKEFIHIITHRKK
jgi:hypothetical protein